MESIDITDSQFSLVVPSPNIMSSLAEFVPEIVDNVDNVGNVGNVISRTHFTEMLKESVDPGLKEGVSLGFMEENYAESSGINSPNTDTDYSSLFFYIGLGIIFIVIGIYVYNSYKNKNSKNSKNVTFQNENNAKNNANYMNSDF
jgi:hypothetical protein